MKTKKILIALFLITIIPMTTLFAQRSAGSYSIGGFVGTGMPMSPDFFKDYWNVGGIGFGGEFIYNFSEKISVGVRFHRLPFPLDTDEIKKMLDPLIEAMVGQIPEGFSYELDGLTLNTNIFSANLLAYLTPPDAATGFYITGGASYYQIDVSDLDITMEYLGQSETQTIEMEDDIDDKFGFNVGGGIEFNAGGMLNVFAEGRYNYLFEEEEGPDFEDGGTDGGSISFISIVAGLRIFL